MAQILGLDKPVKLMGLRYPCGITEYKMTRSAPTFRPEPQDVDPGTGLPIDGAPLWRPGAALPTWGPRRRTYPPPPVPRHLSAAGTREVKNLKGGSLTFQVIARLDSLEAYGISRRETRDAMAKAQGIEYVDAKSPWIHSSSSKESYKKWCLAGATWMKEHFGIKSLKALKPEHVRAFLEFHQAQGHSAWTLKLIGASFGKLLYCSMNDFGFVYPPCRTKDIRRGREATEENTKYGEIHQDLRDFVRATGLRKCEMRNLRGEFFYARPDGKGFIFYLKGKHGKWRVIEPIEASWARAAIDKMYERCLKVGLDKKVWPKVDGTWNEHAERAFYAFHKYQEIARPESRPREWQVHRLDREIMDKRALYDIAAWMGHGRYDVVLRNYWYRH